MEDFIYFDNYLHVFLLLIPSVPLPVTYNLLPGLGILLLKYFSRLTLPLSLYTALVQGFISFIWPLTFASVCPGAA